MTPLWTCLLLLISALYAEPQGSSSASQLAALDPEPSALICGCVHAVTGDFLFQQPDMIVKGAQEIVIPRKYYSSGQEHSIEDQLLPHRKAFGTSPPEIPWLIEALVPEPNGMVFTYLKLEPGAYRPVKGAFQAGISGYLTDYLGNRYHPVNNRVVWIQLNTLLVETSTGEVRVYEADSFGKSYPQFEFRLARIRLANGMLVNFEYKKNRLKKITTSSAANQKKPMSWATFSKKDERLEIKGSDKSQLTYTYKEYKKKLKGKKRKLKLLRHVASTSYPPETLSRENSSTRIKKRHFDQGRELICSYDKSGKVIYLEGPQGPLAAITYEPGHTISVDREGNYTHYHYNPQTLRIDEIQYFQGSDHLLKTEHYIWNSFGCLERKTISSSGHELLQIDCSYDYYLNLIEKTISKGQMSETTTYTYNEKCLLQEEKRQSGERTTYTYLLDTNLPEEICSYHEDHLLKKTLRIYNKDFILTSEITDNGNVCLTKNIDPISTSQFYGCPRHVKELCGDQCISSTSTRYDSYGNIDKIQRYGSDGGAPSITCSRYNEKRQLLEEIDPEGHATHYRYDTSGNLIWKQSPLGLETHYTYDTANRLIEEKEVGSGQEQITQYQDFDPLDQPRKTIDPLGGVTYRHYDALGNLIRQTNSQEHTTTYVYDPLGNITSVTDPLGNTTHTTYDLHNRPLCITHPDGSQQTYTYTPEGNKASYTDEMGTTTYYTYDIHQNLICEEILGGAKTTWTYDAFRLMEKTDPLGNTTTYTYDHLNRKASESYAGATTHYTYDTFNRIASEQTEDLRTEWTYDIKGRVTEQSTFDKERLLQRTHTSYNAQGSPLSITTYPSNQPATSTYTYDAFGREITRTTALGHTTHTSYHISEATRVITTCEPQGICQIAIYNALDQLLTERVQDSEGCTLSETTYTYDPCGNILKRTTATHDTTYTYDSRYRKTTETQANEQTTHYTYYPNGKLHTYTKPDNTTLTYAYDTSGHPTRLTSSRGDIDYAYTYTPSGHLLCSKDLIHQTQTERILDPHGNILEETLANGLTLKSYYDSMGRREQLILPNAAITYTHLGKELASVTIDGKTHHYAYDYSERLIQDTHIDGTTTHYTYDADGRLIQRTHPLLEETLHYDQRDNLIHLIQNGQEQTYTYDSLDHLISEPGHTYSYDPLHNRTHKDSETTTYTPLNQETHLTYDPCGNRLQKEGYYLEYDSLDRLIKVKTWLTTTTYTYDSEHRRILENSTPILWDKQHELGPPDLYRILGRTPFAEIGSAIAIHNRGTLLQPLHTATGDIFQPQQFTAFGEGAAQTRWGYRSKVHDPSGLIYFGRRYYDPNSGRFITTDPEGDIDGPNLYTYTLNNPLTHHDPYGLFTEDRFDPNRFKEVGTAIYHGTVSYARDTALFAGKYLGGIHGPEDMSLADTYAAHLAAGNRLTAATDNWMASSSYAGSSLYNITHKATQIGIDLAASPLLPFGQMKTVGKAARLAGKATQYAPLNQTLLKSRAIAGKVFKSVDTTQHYRPASSAVSGYLLKSKLIAKEISEGHAFAKHVVKRGEFPGFSQRDFREHIQSVVSHPTKTRTLSRNRTAYWDQKTGTVVVRDPFHKDGGTAFISDTGYKYFSKELK